MMDFEVWNGVEMMAIIGKDNSLAVEEEDIQVGYNRRLINTAAGTAALTTAPTASKYKTAYF
jgi:hypothetical protein